MPWKPETFWDRRVCLPGRLELEEEFQKRQSWKKCSVWGPGAASTGHCHFPVRWERSDHSRRDVTLHNQTLCDLFYTERWDSAGSCEAQTGRRELTHQKSLGSAPTNTPSYLPEYVGFLIQKRDLGQLSNGRDIEMTEPRDFGSMKLHHVR